MIQNKAIRDKIPEIIEKSGSKCNVEAHYQIVNF